MPNRRIYQRATWMYVLVCLESREDCLCCTEVFASAKVVTWPVAKEAVTVIIASKRGAGRLTCMCGSREARRVCWLGSDRWRACVCKRNLFWFELVCAVVGFDLEWVCDCAELVLGAGATWSYEVRILNLVNQMNIWFIKRKSTILNFKWKNGEFLPPRSGCVV